MIMYRFIEEPCVVKVTSTVLKTSGYREVLAEFNAVEVVQQPAPSPTPQQIQPARFSGDSTGCGVK